VQKPNKTGFGLGAVAVGRFFGGREPRHCQSTAFWVGPIPSLPEPRNYEEKPEF
jgi:hypothetical protein